METIVACRETISERFPVASFTVHVPERRLYEVVCATDPRLLHTDNAPKRTPSNFYSSRIGGLLPAQRGANTFILPAEQLRRFAGARRIFYALGTYAGNRGEQPRFTVAPDSLERVPSVGLAVDFTGRSLDQRRLGAGASSAHYGSQARPVLRWGGDAALEAERAQLRRSASASRPTEPRLSGYDDGFDPSLWTGGQARARASAAQQPVGYGGAPGINYEDAPSLRGDRRPGAEPAARYGEVIIEDGAQAWLRKLASPLVGMNEARPSQAREANANYGRPEPVLIEDGAHSRSLGRASEVMTSEPGRRNGSYGAVAPASPAGPAGHVGYEDAASLRACASGLVRPVAELRARPREHHSSSSYGRRTASDGSDDSSSAGHRRHADYCEQLQEQSLPIGPAVSPLGEPAPTRRALTIADQVQILRRVGRVESGDDGYAAVLADVASDDGLAWGLLAFRQRSGALGRVLALAKAREAALLEAGQLPDAQRFDQLFGEHWSALLEQTDTTRTPDPEQRVRPVGGALLWAEPWLARFRAAGRVPYIQAAQNQVGVETYFDSILPIARAFDLASARALAVLVDRVIHMGVGAGSAWLLAQLGPITSEALRDRALDELGFAGDLAGFLRARRIEGGWTPLAHAALVADLRAHASPIVNSLPTGDAALRRLGEAARGTDFESRLRALLDASDLDATQLFDLG